MTQSIPCGDSVLIAYAVPQSLYNFYSKEMTVLQKENLILEKQVHSYQTAIAQKDSKGEYDPSHMATRPQPPGQAQPGYGDSQMDRKLSGMADPYYRGGIPQHNHMGSNVPNHMGSNLSNHTGPNLPNQMGGNVSLQHNGQYVQSNMASQPGIGHMGNMVQGSHLTSAQNHVGYDPTFGGNELSTQDPYGHISRNQMDGNCLPVPVDRGRSKSADPSGYYNSPTPDRRPTSRRNSTTGSEYADQLEQSPRYNRSLMNNYDGYRSDSDYRSDVMGKPNGPRYNEHYSKHSSRPKPSMRTSKPSDSRSDFGDYYSEQRSKVGYDRDMDTYSERSHKASTGGKGRTNRGQPVGDSRRSNMLNSTGPTGRASYAGYDSDYMPSESGRSGSSYPNTPRSSVGQRNTSYPRSDDRRPMENGPH